MTARIPFRSMIALGASVLLLAGCGGDGGPELVPVSGIVTLNGQPLPGATIIFSPASGSDSITTGTDATGPEGNYKVQYQGRFGLSPGKYVVQVSKEVTTGGPPVTVEQMVDEAGNPIGEDPDMAAFAIESHSQGEGGIAVPKTTKVEEAFEREIPPEGGIFDFDVKATAAEASILRAG